MVLASRRCAIAQGYFLNFQSAGSFPARFNRPIKLRRSIRSTSIAQTIGRPLPAPLPDLRPIGIATWRRTLIVFVRCHDLSPPKMLRRWAG